MDSAVVGLVGVMIGALLGGLITWLNQRAQLKHDAAQRLLEREHELRKSLFIEGAAGLQQANKALFILGKVEANLEDASKEFAEGLAKLSMIGYAAEQLTLEATTALTNEFGLVLLQTLLNRKGMDDARRDVEICQKTIERYLLQQTHATELMKEHNLSGNADPEAFARIQRYFDHTTTELDRLFEERDNLQTTSDSAMAEFMKSVLPLRERLATLTVKAVVAIRTELGFPIDEAWLLGMSTRSSSVAGEAMDAFLNTLFEEPGKPHPPNDPSRP